MNDIIKFLDKNYKTFGKTDQFGCSQIIGLACLSVCTIFICILLYVFINPLSSIIAFLVVLIFIIVYVNFSKPIEHEYVNMIKSFSGIDFGKKYRIWFIDRLSGYTDIIIVFEKKDFIPIKEQCDRLIENKSKYIDEYNIIDNSFEIYQSECYRHGFRKGFYKRFQSEGINKGVESISWEHIELQVDYEDCTIRFIRVSD